MRYKFGGGGLYLEGLIHGGAYFRNFTVFKNVLQNEQNKLHELLPARNTCIFNLRNMRKFKPAFKTNRFRTSFITFNALKALTVLVDF